MNKDILICGVGGQGTVLASKIIASAAMTEGHTVHSAETIGMAQRGGSVTSHVRIGDEAYSPLLPHHSADLILGFEPAEAVRNIDYLRPEGVVVVNTGAVKPVTDALSDSGYSADAMTEYLTGHFRCILIDGAKECASFGSPKFMNMLLLGAAAGSGKLGLSKDVLISEIEKRVPPKYTQINEQVFLHGFSLGADS